MQRNWSRQARGDIPESQRGSRLVSQLPALNYSSSGGSVSAGAAALILGAFLTIGSVLLLPVRAAASAATGPDCHDYALNPDVVPIATLPTDGATIRVDARGGIACLASEYAGLEVLDLTPAASRLGAVDVGGRLSDVCIARDELLGFAAVVRPDGSSALVVLDVAPPLPVVLSSVAVPGSATSLAYANSEVVVASGLEGVVFVDTSNPFAPRVSRTIVLPGFASAVAYDGRFVLVGAAASGTVVIDTASGDHVGLLSGGGTNTTDVLMRGRYAYVAMETGIAVVDLEDDPTTVAEVFMPSGFASGLAADSNFLYASLADGGFDVIAWSDPRELSVVASLAGPEAVDIAVSDDSVVLSAFSDGTAIYRRQCSSEDLCVANGDVNGDGALSPVDAWCALDAYLYGSDAPPCAADLECSVPAADVNCDGIVSPRDAFNIFKRWRASGGPEECFAGGLGKEDGLDAGWVAAQLAVVDPQLRLVITAPPVRSGSGALRLNVRVLGLAGAMGTPSASPIVGSTTRGAVADGNAGGEGVRFQVFDANGWEARVLPSSESGVAPAAANSEGETGRSFVIEWEQGVAGNGSIGSSTCFLRVVAGELSDMRRLALPQ